MGFEDKQGCEDREDTAADMEATGLCCYLSEDGRPMSTMNMRPGTFPTPVGIRPVGQSVPSRSRGEIRATDTGACGSREVGPRRWCETN